MADRDTRGSNAKAGTSEPAPTCLVVDDDEMTAAAIQKILHSDGFEVDLVGDGETAVARVAQKDPDIVVLDFNLPGINGHQAAKKIREMSDTYILILTGNNREVDKVLALSTASDDYMTKPFSTAELTARLRALLRRSRKNTATSPSDVAPGMISVGKLEIDAHARRVAHDGQDISVTRIEFDILCCLTKGVGVCILRDVMIRQVWGAERGASAHSLDVHMHNLRRKLEHLGVVDIAIEAVRGVGFRLVAK